MDIILKHSFLKSMVGQGVGTKIFDNKEGLLVEIIFMGDSVGLFDGDDDKV